MFLSINEHDKRPIYLQIINQVKEQVRRGDLQPGAQLPSVREVADSLGINMHTVRSAYLKLRDQGIITIRLGRRARVARRQPAAGGLDADFQMRLRELLTDALLAGTSPDDLRKLVDRQIAALESENRI